jgi:hypothetical protein
MPATRKQETTLDVTATVARLLPILGGPVAGSWEGYPRTGRFEHVREVIARVDQELRGVDKQLGALSEGSPGSIKSEDFRSPLKRLFERYRRNAMRRSAEPTTSSSSTRSLRGASRTTSRFASFGLSKSLRATTSHTWVL